MAWVRQSDDFYDHPKLIEVGPLGIALFFGVIAFCNRNLTDGFIRVSKARTVLDFDGMHLPIVDTGGVLEVDGDALLDGLVAAMIENGLWHQPGHACDACHARADGGEPKRGHVLVHDYFDFQASKEYVEGERAKAKRRMATNRAKNVRPNTARTSEDVRLTPTPSPSPTPRGTPGGALGGEGYVSNARAGERPHCSKHSENHEGPCRTCQRRREWDDAHAAEFAATELGKRRALYEARLSCPKCDPNGMIDTGKGLARCGAHGEAL